MTMTRRKRIGKAILETKSKLFILFRWGGPSVLAAING